MTEYIHFGTILLFLIIGAVFILVVLTAGAILRPRKFYKDKTVTYECGEDAVGFSFLQFHPRFFVIALVFIIFDVEAAILLPWACIFKQFGIVAFVEMLIFIFILIVAFAYVWAKGDLRWLLPYFLSNKKDEDSRHL